MARRPMSPDLLAEISAARAAGRRVQSQPWWPVKVHFDDTSDRLVIDFRDGASLRIPKRALPELKGARRKSLERVELVGDAIRWDELDVDVSVRGLISDWLGPRFSTESSGRMGGRSKSRAKIAAARANGRKGGRPRDRPRANT
jgi:hypothetical protein